MKQNIIVISNTEWGIYNFRLELIKMLINHKQSLEIICERQEIKYLDDNEFIVHNLILNKNKGFLSELINFISLLMLFRKFKPKYVLSFTIKPNFYSALIKIFFKYNLIINITGLGKMFSTERNFITKIFLRICIN